MGSNFLHYESRNKRYLYRQVRVCDVFGTFVSLNFGHTALISFRIWSVDRAAGKYLQSENTLRPVLAVVVESGAIYSASLVALLATFLSHSWAQYIVLDAVSPSEDNYPIGFYLNFASRSLQLL